MQGAVGDCEGALLIDCENLSYISSAGLGAILLIAKALAKRNVPFGLCTLQSPVAEVFEVSGFDRIISTHRTRAVALGAIGG